MNTAAVLKFVGGRTIGALSGLGAATFLKKDICVSQQHYTDGRWNVTKYAKDIYVPSKSIVIFTSLAVGQFLRAPLVIGATLCAWTIDYVDYQKDEQWKAQKKKAQEKIDERENEAAYREWRKRNEKAMQ